MRTTQSQLAMLQTLARAFALEHMHSRPPPLLHFSTITPCIARAVALPPPAGGSCHQPAPPPTAARHLPPPCAPIRRAAKKKGMSLEEKRNTMLGILHENGGDVFVLKARAAKQESLGRRLCGGCCPAAACRRTLGDRPTPCCASLRLQELEKTGAKRGVVMQTVKDVLQVRGSG